MRLDPDLKWQILERVSIYSGRLSIAEPRVLLTTRDVLEVPRQMTRVTLIENFASHAAVQEFVDVKPD